MRRVVCWIIVLLPYFLAAQDSMDIFEQANEYYRNGNFSQAIQGYEKALASGEDGNIFYNLGNAHYKNGDLALAILNYEKAGQLLPNDADLTHNLNVARLRIVDKIEPSPEFFLVTWWKKAAGKVRSERWAMSFLVLFWTSAIFMVLYVFRRGRLRGTLLALAVSGATAALICLLMAVTQYRMETSDRHAIILSSSVSVKSAPAYKSTDLFIIHEGLKIEVTGQDGDWLRICLPDGKVGWIPADMASVI